MKKNYMTPSVVMVKLENTLMDSTSNDINNLQFDLNPVTTDEGDAKRGASIFDDGE